MSSIFTDVLLNLILTSWRTKQRLSPQMKKVLDEAYAIFRQQNYKKSSIKVQYYRLLMLIIRYLR